MPTTLLTRYAVTRHGTIALVGSLNVFNDTTGAGICAAVINYLAHVHYSTRVCIQQHTYAIDKYTYAIDAYTYAIDAYTYAIDACTYAIDAYTYAIDAYTYAIDAYTYAIDAYYARTHLHTY